MTHKPNIHHAILRVMTTSAGDKEAIMPRINRIGCARKTSNGTNLAEAGTGYRAASTAMRSRRGMTPSATGSKSGAWKKFEKNRYDDHDRPSTAPVSSA